MIHQPLGGASGQAVDIEIQAKEIMYHKANLNRLMAFHTGQDVKQVDEDTDRDRYMSPLEAKNYGIIDEIIGGDSAGLEIVGEPKEYLKTKGLPQNGDKPTLWGRAKLVHQVETGKLVTADGSNPLKLKGGAPRQGRTDRATLPTGGLPLQSRTSASSTP